MMNQYSELIKKLEEITVSGSTITLDIENAYNDTWQICYQDKTNRHKQQKSEA